MENFKFTVFSIIALVLVGLLGYWAFTSLQSGTEHVANEKIQQLEDENKELKENLENLNEELEILKPAEEIDAEASQGNEEIVEEIENTPTPSQAASKYQSLINELQELINDKVYMKLNSKGTRVGTVQNFLNIYNNTSNRIDNAYGAGTKSKVLAFQKAQGLTADGEAGSATFQKMIDWLKKQ